MDLESIFFSDLLIILKTTADSHKARFSSLQFLPTWLCFEQWQLELCLLAQFSHMLPSYPSLGMESYCNRVLKQSGFRESQFSRQVISYLADNCNYSLCLLGCCRAAGSSNLSKGEFNYTRGLYAGVAVVTDASLKKYRISLVLIFMEMT